MKYNIQNHGYVVGQSCGDNQDISMSFESNKPQFSKEEVLKYGSKLEEMLFYMENKRLPDAAFVGIVKELVEKFRAINVSQSTGGK